MLRFQQTFILAHRCRSEAHCLRGRMVSCGVSQEFAKHRQGVDRLAVRRIAAL
jgi:hypothetical protein